MERKQQQQRRYNNNNNNNYDYENHDYDDNDDDDNDDSNNNNNNSNNKTTKTKQQQSSRLHQLMVDNTTFHVEDYNSNDNIILTDERPIVDTSKKSLLQQQEQTLLLGDCAHLIYTTINGCKLYIGPIKLTNKSYEHILHKANIQAIVNCTQFNISCRRRRRNKKMKKNKKKNDNDDNNNNDNDEYPIYYCQIPVSDLQQSNILIYLDNATKFIHTCLNYYNVNVYVHCAVGISRSATIIIAYYIKYLHYTLYNAYIHVKSIRASIYPNNGFWKQLQLYQYEIQLQKQNQDQQCNNDNANTRIEIIQFNINDDNNCQNINSKWSKQSLVMYCTLHTLNNDIIIESYNNDSCNNNNNINILDACFGGCKEYIICNNNNIDSSLLSSDTVKILNNNDNRQEERIKYVILEALDCVWGHGVQEYVIEWFIALCEYIITNNNNNNNNNNKILHYYCDNISINKQQFYDCIIEQITNPKSEFATLYYPNEIILYPNWVQKIKLGLLQSFVIVEDNDDNNDNNKEDDDNEKMIIEESKKDYNNVVVNNSNKSVHFEEVIEDKEGKIKNDFEGEEFFV